MPNKKEQAMNPFSQIRQIDYTVIFARDMDAMRHFYGEVMGFSVDRTLGDNWIEYRVGSNTLALTAHGSRFNDAPPPPGALSIQMAFRVAPDMVAKCASALDAKGIRLTHPLTDHPFGHRTIFFRDPDGNVIEIFAEI
jgi:catechol 2,3-dioxygenase-like lactoylglutathione lyase family enzyme